MCIVSTLILIIYVIFLIVGAAMTIASLVTPGWRTITADTVNVTMSPSSMKGLTEQINFGLFGQCGGHDLGAECKDWFMSLETWNKIAVAAMVLAVVCIVVAICWTFVTCLACCCKSCLTPPLPILSGMATGLLITGIALFINYGKESFDFEKYPKGWDQMAKKSDFGWSMWVGVGAIIVMAVDTVIGVILVKVSKTPL